MNPNTMPLEAETRVLIDRSLENLGWKLSGKDQNVYYEQPRSEAEKKKLCGKRPDYVLYSKDMGTSLKVAFPLLSETAYISTCCPVVEVPYKRNSWPSTKPSSDVFVTTRFPRCRRLLKVTMDVPPETTVTVCGGCGT